MGPIHEIRPARILWVFPGMKIRLLAITHRITGVISNDPHRRNAGNGGSDLAKAIGDTHSWCDTHCRRCGACGGFLRLWFLCIMMIEYIESYTLILLPHPPHTATVCLLPEADANVQSRTVPSLSRLVAALAQFAAEHGLSQWVVPTASSPVLVIAE